MRVGWLVTIVKSSWPERVGQHAEVVEIAHNGICLKRGGSCWWTQETYVEPLYATRVKQHEAKRHFDAGGSVLVSEWGSEPTQLVSVGSTTHNNQTTTWSSLVEDVRMWRNRYPNQRFYIVPMEQEAA